LVLDLELSGTVNRTTPYPFKNRNDPIKDFVDPTILTAKGGSNGSTILIENSSCLNVKEESILKIENGATLHLKTCGFIHVKDEDSKLVLDNGSTLEMEDNAFIEIKNGGTLEINTGNININDSNTRIIIKAGGILKTSNNTSFDFVGSSKLIIEEGAIIDMPFDLTGEGPNHVAILLDQAWTGAPVIDMKHKFYLTDCKVLYKAESSIIITDERVKFNNVTFEPASDAAVTSTAFTGNNLKYFNCKNSRFENFVNALVLDDYWFVQPNPSDPCDNPVQPTFSIKDSHFENIDVHAVSCINIYRLYAENNFFTNDVAGSWNQKAIYGEKCNLELVENTIEKYGKGVDLDGVLTNSPKYVNISGGSISYCKTGVSTSKVNVNIKYCANISNNEDYGIYSAAGIYQRQLTIGRNGGALVTGNGTAIKGVNIILDIDVFGTADDAGIYNPNDMSGNTVFFDLSYPDTEEPTGISVRGNYWGSIYENGTTCGASIHEINGVLQEPGSYNVPSSLSEADIDDAHFLSAAPGSGCVHPGNACGLMAPDSNTGTLNTNFGLIYNIASDYLEEEVYESALFGYSLLANFEDEPVYNLLAINDQNTVILSRIQEETLVIQTGGFDTSCNREDPVLLFPKIEIVEIPVDETKLIESVSPNPFIDAIELVTVLKQTYKVEIFNSYQNINGEAVKQLKADTPKLKIDLSDLKPGVYVIKIIDAEGRSDYKEILKTY